MAMDFFEAQDRAKRQTTLLIVLFTLAVLAIVLALNLVAFGVLALTTVNDGRDGGRTYNQPGYRAPQTQAELTFDWWRPDVYGLVTLGTLGLIGGASGFKALQLGGNGGNVARMLGGRPLDPDTSDPDERKLLNVVEEMAIASGVAVPDVYVMDHEGGINAFAAGSSIEQAAIGVTRGCMTKLNRDELQGVIAHEFSHILNGDMRLNVRLIGIIFGILVIGLIGLTVMRSVVYAGAARRRSSDKDKGGGVLVILAVGLALTIIGYVGMFFGRLIQAAVSRQREYLADASAVQFTRNPHGIAGALQKIGGSVYGSKVSNRHAGEISHMFFATGFSSLFATHPPLPERIRRIDPQWDGQFVEPQAEEPAHDQDPRVRREREDEGMFGGLGIQVDMLQQNAQSGFATGRTGGEAMRNEVLQFAQNVAAARGVRLNVDPAAVARQVGRLDAEHIEFAHDLVGQIPDEIRARARKTDGARGLVYAMLFADRPDVRERQFAMLRELDRNASDDAKLVYDQISLLGPAIRLPLIDLATPILRRLPADSAERCRRTMSQLVHADEQVEPFEFAVTKVVDRQLRGPGGEATKPRRIRYYAVNGLDDEIALLLSALAMAGDNDPQTTQSAFALGVAKLGQPIRGNFRGRFNHEQLSEAMDKLAQGSPAVKRRVIDAAATVVAADGTVEIAEAELLRATAAVLECPLPPFMQAVGSGASTGAGA